MSSLKRKGPENDSIELKNNINKYKLNKPSMIGRLSNTNYSISVYSLEDGLDDFYNRNTMPNFTSKDSFYNTITNFMQKVLKDIIELLKEIR